MKAIFLYTLWAVVINQSYCQTNRTLTGLYKATGLDSYLSIVEHKKNIKGMLFEKERDPLSLIGIIKDDSLSGTIRLSELAERKWVGKMKNETITLSIFIPDTPISKTLEFSFVQIRKSPKTSVEQLFGKIEKYPKELLGTWVQYDLVQKKETGYIFLKGGDLRFVGLELPDGIKFPGQLYDYVTCSWYVKDKKNLCLTVGKEVGLPMPFTIDTNKLTIALPDGSSETLYRKTK